jgi:hypothetical protein
MAQRASNLNLRAQAEHQGRGDRVVIRRQRILPGREDRLQVRNHIEPRCQGAGKSSHRGRNEKQPF